MIPGISNDTEGMLASAPSPQSERIASLDVLRGAALLGILAINIQIFAGSPSFAFNMPLRAVAYTGSHPIMDAATMILQWMFFEGKMRALFSMLFGAGTILLLDKVAKHHGERTAKYIFLRRNFWLLAIGIIHGTLIWSGDVLLLYSSIAILALYPFRHLSGNRLVALGLTVAIFGGTFGISNLMSLRTAWSSALLEEAAQDAVARGARPTEAQTQALARANAERLDQIRALSAPPLTPAPTYMDNLPARAFQQFVMAIYSSGWILETMGLFIAGMGLLKVGFLNGSLPFSTYVRVAVCGYSVAFVIIISGMMHSYRYGFTTNITTVWMMLPYEVQSVSAALANAAVLILAIKNNIMLSAQRSLAATGRMALSNYILTSIICQVLLAWSGIIPPGSLEHHQLIFIVCAIWIMNVTFSLLWLRFFAFGPLEWLWRSLTYWHFQPNRKSS